MVRLIRLADLMFFRLHRTSKDPVEVAQALLGIVCSDPREKSRIITFVGNIFRVYIVILGILSATNLYFSSDIWMFASTFEGFMVAVQTVNDQVLCLFLYHKEILMLVDQRKMFWDPEIFDPADESRSRRKIKETLRVLNIFGVFMICLGIVYTTYGICFSMLPIKYWLPQGYHFLDKIMMVTEAIWFAYSCISVLAFNALFIGFCINICVQYRLISYRLQNVATFTQISANGTKKLKNEMKVLVEHHIFVLKYSQLIRDTFSLHFLIRLVETVGMMCVALYIASDRGSTFYQMFRSAQLCTALIMQFSLDCYMAHDLMFESRKVGDAAYNSEWYSSPALASYIKMIIIRATKPVTLTAAGIVEINKQTMASVLKTTVSYLTALKTMEADNK